MNGTGGGDGATSTQPGHLLLAMRSGRTRNLVEEWLSTVPEYRVTVADAVPAEATYDLCLVDEATCRERADRLRDLKAAAGPVYLPHLLLGDDGEWLTADRDGAAAVDDTVSLPVEQSVLRRRIESHLRTRRASIRLRDREEQYEQLVELTPEGILFVADGEIRYANRAVMDLLGVEGVEALRGRSVYEFVAETDRGQLRSLFDAVATDGRHEEFVDVEFETPGGETAETTVAGVEVTFEDDRVTQLLIRDLTEARQRRRRLDLLGRTVEAAAHGITVADARQDDLPLIYANAAFERITGYDSAEVIGRNCRFLQGEGTDEETVATMRTAIEAERPVAVEILNYRKDGTPFWNRVNIVPVTDDGTVTHYLGFQQDVSERREREERLSVLNRVLRHNLRNRLNVVRGYAEGLRPEDGTEREAVERVLDAVDELLDMTEQVRRFQGVVDSGRDDLEEYDLVTLCEEVVSEFRRECPAATVRLTHPDEAVVEAHRTLPLALGELLELAAESPETDPDLEVRIAEADDWVTATVTDRAGSVPTADLDVLADDDVTPTGHPQGVGAWLLRWAVRYSRGETTVEETDDGTVIRLSFRPAGRR